jgi:hypothetical protein
VLCPGFVRTRIGESGRNRQGALRPGADAGPREFGGRTGGPDRPTVAVRARPVGGRRAGPCRDPSR